MTFRRSTREERTLVNRAFGRWNVFELFKGETFLVQENGGSRKVCLAPPELQEAALRLQPYLAGLVVGELKKQFSPSLQGADLFARAGKRNRYYVVVSEKAEELVLYGRDVLGESILEHSEELEENELVIILNSRLEAIGIGRTRFSGTAMREGKVAITTIQDAGSYLRDEDKQDRTAGLANLHRRGTKN